MERIVTQTRFPKPNILKPKRVAAYARVSTGKDAMLHSLSAQISYYTNLIQNRKDWELVGVYADEALTGTKADREKFQKLLTDCRNGKVDMIITKSISRFARNTVTLLETVRELKNIGVDVYFEEQNIHSASADGELMLTILASYAQEESLSASENQKWRVRQNFRNGKIMNVRSLFGYKVKGDTLEIDPETAPVVREIYRRAINGESFGSIARDLNARGITGVYGGRWQTGRIAHLLENEKYCGNALLQKRYRNNHIEKKEKTNKGELTQYYATDTHEAIIDEATLNAAQEILQRYKAQKAMQSPCEESAFTGKIVCGICGKKYKRITSNGKKSWCCYTYRDFGKAACPSKQIPEEELYRIAIEITDDFDKITAVTADENNTLIFHLADGKTAVKQWQPRSRRNSWTPEMKENARNRALERRMPNDHS